MEAVHFTELRMRFDELRSRYRLPTLRWTDPEPHPPKVNPIIRVHLTELRPAIVEA